MTKENYKEKIGFLSREELKLALESYASSEGLKPSVVCRKAVYEYLMKKGVLKKGIRYL